MRIPARVQPWGQPGRDRLGRVAPGGALRRGQGGQRARQHQPVAVEFGSDRRQLLLEQPLPGLHAADRLLGQDPLLGLGQPVGPGAAQHPQPVGVALQGRIGDQPLRGLLVERDPLQVEEGGQRLHAGRHLLHLAHQGAVLRWLGVGVEAQHRVCVRGAQRLERPPEFRMGAAQRGGVVAGRTPPVALRKRLR